MRMSAERIRRTAAWALVLILWCAGLGSVLAADRLKAETLQHALAGMGESRRTLSEQAGAAAALSHRLQALSRQLQAEIARERQLQGIGSFPQALQVERIGYNLRLVQRIDGYLERIERRIGHFRALDHALEFNMRGAQDELLALKTLEDRDISELASRIQSVLNEVARETAKPLLNASDPPSRSLELVWNELARTP